MNVSVTRMQEMLAGQQQYNDIHEPGWRDEPRPWHRAVCVHAVRLLALSGGWQDMSRGPLPNAQEIGSELRTIWGYGMSMEMERRHLKPLDDTQLAARLHDDITRHYREAIEGFLTPDTEAFVAILDGFISFAGAGIFHIQSFAYLMALAKLAPEALDGRIGSTSIA